MRVTPWERVASYPYHDEAGSVLYTVDRYHRSERLDDGTIERGRRFVQWHAGPDGRPIYSIAGVRRVLYDLPSVLLATRQGGRVWVVEGERDADTISDYHRHETGTHDRATTNPGGAGSWRGEYADSLRGARVLVWPDDDEPGRRHAATIAASLRGVAASVTVLQPADVAAICGGHDDGL